MSERPLTDSIVSALQAVLGTTHNPVPLHEPDLKGNEQAYIKDCIHSTFVSTVGAYVGRFERCLIEYTGIRHAVAVVNGTAALHAALMAIGVGVGDEVLVPALTFVATANAVAYTGAVPHFVDSEERTLGVDPDKLAAYLSSVAQIDKNGCSNRHTGRRIKAVIPMHTFGHPVDIDRLCDVCQQYSISVIEDAAEALGSLYKGRHVGGKGRMSILSFNGNKIITTGGGGAILTNDTQLAEDLRHLTTTAKLPHRWTYHHDQVAFNYRMPNLNAALGCAQIERLPHMVEKKRRLAERYADAFADVHAVQFFVEPEFARSNYWLNAILIDPAHGRQRDAVLSATHESGYLTRPVWTLMHRLPMFRNCPKMDLSVAKRIESRLINLPSSACL